MNWVWCGGQKHDLWNPDQARRATAGQKPNLLRVPIGMKQFSYKKYSMCTFNHVCLIVIQLLYVHLSFSFTYRVAQNFCNFSSDPQK